MATQTNFYSIYESPLGKLAIYSYGMSVYRLEVAPMHLTSNTQNDNLPIFAETKHWLDIYFSGKNPGFTPPLDFYGTDFQKKVWRKLLEIDFGHTATYGEIANRIGCRSAQAVGQAIGKNPILIIVPCHRIVASGGKIGGFSAGIKRKIWLIKNEGLENLRI
jgi:O-6-methylguanine DNA methyltransferase